MLRTLKFIKNYLIGILLGMLFGVLTYVVQPVRWEAHALVRLASYQTSILETAPIVIERLKTPSFLVAATERAKSNHVKISKDYDKCKCVQAKLVGYKDDMSVLMITVDSNDPASSLGAVDSVVKQLQFKHKELLDQNKVEVENGVALIQRNIDSINSKLKLIKDQPALSDSRSILMELMQTRFAAENRLYTHQNFPSNFNVLNTRLLEPIFVEEHRLFSSLLRALLFGSILGVFLSVVWMRFKCCRRPKTDPLMRVMPT